MAASIQLSAVHIHGVIIGQLGKFAQADIKPGTYDDVVSPIGLYEVTRSAFMHSIIHALMH